MLKGCNRRKAQSLFELLYKLPGVESVKKVDVAGASAEYFYRQVVAVCHVDF